MIFGAPASTNFQSSFQNISSTTVTFNAGGNTYTLAPLEVVTLFASDAQASQSLAYLLLSGAVGELTVYGGSQATVTPSSSASVTPAAISFDAAQFGNLTGSFAGVIIDPVSTRWELSNGNRMIYPNSRLRSQPSPGPQSVVSVGAVFQRSNLDGSLGFAIYTDAATTASSFNNGYLSMYGPDGLPHIWLVQNSVWTEITEISTQIAYPLDLSEHQYSTVMVNASGTQVEFISYVDGLVYAQAQVGVLFSNGVIGFSLIGGAGPVLVGPGSFAFDIGSSIPELLPPNIQAIISGVEQVINPNTGTLQPGVVTIASLIGDTSGNTTSPIINTNTLTLEYAIAPQGIQAGVGSVGQLNAYQYATGTTAATGTLLNGTHVLLGSSGPNLLPAGGTWLNEYTWACGIELGTQVIAFSAAPASYTLLPAVAYQNLYLSYVTGGLGRFQFLAPGGSTSTVSFSGSSTSNSCQFTTGVWTYEATRISS